MRDATLFNYNIPIEAGVILRNQRLTLRSGLLVRLREDGREGWGEIAPLPGFSRETLAQAQAAAADWLQSWLAGAPASQATQIMPPASASRAAQIMPPASASQAAQIMLPASANRATQVMPPASASRAAQIMPPASASQATQIMPPASASRATQIMPPASGGQAEVLPPLPDFPSAAFGLSCALAELAGELPLEGCFASATLCTGDPHELVNQLARQPQPVAKMKVGLYEAARDGMIATLLLEAIPTLTLRLDANRQWNLDKALQFARFVPEQLRSRIAFIEEPCRTPQDSRRFAQETGIALAWDESSREPGFAPAAEPHLSAIIIKPSLVGSLAQVNDLIVRSAAAGLTAVISSSLESSLGLTQLARLASWRTPGVIPGLDTLPLMQRQLVRGWPGSPLPPIGVEELERVW